MSPSALGLLVSRQEPHHSPISQLVDEPISAMSSRQLRQPMSVINARTPNPQLWLHRPHCHPNLRQSLEHC